MHVQREDRNSSAGINRSTDHTLYGTTLQATPTSGGSNFKVSLPSGLVTVLYTFPDPKLGIYPYALTLASDGYLYGVASEGGPLYGQGSAGPGVIFRLSTSGTGYQIIHAFNGTTEGSGPVAGLVEQKSPNGQDYLYGSTAGGGATRGVLFRVSIGSVGPPNFQVLYTFPDAWADTGSFPHSTMVAMNDPKYGLTFFGTTLGGGTYNYGALFRMTAWICRRCRILRILCSIRRCRVFIIGERIRDSGPASGYNDQCTRELSLNQQHRLRLTL